MPPQACPHQPAAGRAAAGDHRHEAPGVGTLPVGPRPPPWLAAAVPAAMPGRPRGSPAFMQPASFLHKRSQRHAGSVNLDGSPLPFSCSCCNKPKCRPHDSEQKHPVLPHSHPCTAPLAGLAPRARAAPPAQTGQGPHRCRAGGCRPACRQPRWRRAAPPALAPLRGKGAQGMWCVLVGVGEVGETATSGSRRGRCRRRTAACCTWRRWRCQCPSQLCPCMQGRHCQPCKVLAPACSAATASHAQSSPLRHRCRPML
jgi:hypothetical protein